SGGWTGRTARNGIQCGGASFETGPGNAAPQGVTRGRVVGIRASKTRTRNGHGGYEQDGYGAGTADGAGGDGSPPATGIPGHLGQEIPTEDQAGRTGRRDRGRH